MENYIELFNKMSEAKIKMQSCSCDNGYTMLYNQVLNLFYTELLLIDTSPVTKQKLEELRQVIWVSFVLGKLKMPR